MSFFEQIIISVILILFPINIYLLFISYRDNKKNNKFILDICCLFSMYLIIRVINIYFAKSVYLMLLVNIPLIISFLYKRKINIIILSAVIIIYYFITYNINLYFLIFEYLFYIIFYCVCDINLKKNHYIFLLIKGITLSIMTIYIFPDDVFYVAVYKTILILIIFYLVSYFIVIYIKRADDIMNLNSVLSELNKEKQIKNSLFKITHEVKNPISVALGYLQMMDYNDIEKVKRYNNIIKSEIYLTLSIMDDFNSYSKISVIVEPMDLVMLIDDTINACLILLKNKKIKIINQNNYKEIFILGDYNRLKQVFINIIKNSVESIVNSGEIKLNVKKDKKMINIIFSDTGCGMDRYTLNKIGELFYTTKDKGTGIGVAMSKEIITKHNGFIKYSSKIGKGTCVKVSLPLEIKEK